MTLAIIIVNWNVKDLLADCLRSVEAELARSGLPAQVWVVDNASTDGSAEMVRDQFPSVRLIASSRNLGFAGGNNAALRALGFGDPSLPGDRLPEAVLLLNPDTRVHPGALTAITGFLADRPRAGIVGARLVYGDGSFQHSAFDFPGLRQLAIELLPLPARLTETRLNGRYPRAWYEQGRPFRIGHPLGAAMTVRREAIRQAGLLDEQYHMYVEEVDWSLRITRAGWEAYCVPAAVITHLGGQSTGQIKTTSFINLWTSRYRFYRKHYAGPKVWLARQIVRAGMRRLARRDKQAAAHGDLPPAILEERLNGYRTVCRVWETTL
ncbi:MAG: glycosyltransferase family 2 protein [Chloroflexi bacterium]|nr:MAG: glycosyltransferase family 2 protein [Chloroflexota bacterium]